MFMTIFAYIDPGLGALIWQSAIAAFVGFVFYLKKTRRWIVDVFRKIFARERETPSVPPPAPATVPAAKAEVKVVKVEVQ
jgi:hypothetical protein